MNRFLHQTIFFLALSAMTAGAQSSTNVPAYETGYKAIMRLGSDLQKAIKPKYRSVIHVQPVSLETDMMPFVRPVEYPDDAQPLRMVFISVGFVDLMNNVAHAKAIDKLQKGYFDKYIASLAQESGAMSLKDLPGLTDKKYWSEEVLNEQLSNFNQMVGMSVSIGLAHHYLGHYRKYESRLTDTNGRPVAISSLLSADEWDVAVRTGAANSLECGLGVEGVKALYEAIAKMPQRPAWTAYFLPANANVEKIRKSLDKYEKLYFQGTDLW